MFYNSVDEYDQTRQIIHLCLENALDRPISGVIDAELTYGGTIGGNFLDASNEPYFYELDSDGVIFAPHDDSIRIDAAKGKKCPGGYWIPKDKECKRANMTPSAKKTAGGLKGAIATGLVTAGVVGAGVDAKRMADNKKAQAAQIASQQAAAEARKPINRAKAIARKGGEALDKYVEFQDKVGKDWRAQAGLAGAGLVGLGVLVKKGKELNERQEREQRSGGKTPETPTYEAKAQTLPDDDNIPISKTTKMRRDAITKMIANRNKQYAN